LASVHHPFIVDMFLTFQTPSNLFMCLEYMVGGELFSHLRKEGRFVPDVAKFYAASIVLALEYLHDNDIIYRDLKPEVPPSSSILIRIYYWITKDISKSLISDSRKDVQIEHGQSVELQNT
jgi:serine/threonine protein kinase